MRKYDSKGAMTVFFSIVTVVLLSLMCSLAESVRMQGARAKAAAVLDLGIFSVFGEYERALYRFLRPHVLFQAPSEWSHLHCVAPD